MTKAVAVNTQNEAHPSIVEEAMAVETTDADEGLAAPRGAGSEVLLEDMTSSRRRRNARCAARIICTLMCMFPHCPKHVQSESLCVRFGESLSTYYKTGDGHFVVESLPVAPSHSQVPPARETPHKVGHQGHAGQHTD